MKKVFLKLFLVLGFGITLFICYLIIIIIYGTITDYKPDNEEVISVNVVYDTLEVSEKYSLLIWNIGYCGLGKNEDFFYDGGKNVITTKQEVIKNFKKISDFIIKNDSIDFIQLQEVDISSKRSYDINQFDSLKAKLNKFEGKFGLNYKVNFVPVPFFSPLCKVTSGLCNFSKHKTVTTKRFAYPGNFIWPKKIFMPDRCYLVSRYKVNNDKELLIINTHNSAFDDGSLKKSQMNILKEFILNEYTKGNYIVIAGDWNQLPAGLKIDEFSKNISNNIVYSSIDSNLFSEDWKWIYDKSFPTNRDLSAPLNKNTYKTIFDYFLFSQNVENILVKTIDMGFENSDHNPVVVIFKLNSEI
ncbi:MAG: hypothetical protein KAT68_00360 [Bacteroidales bacterium]|nr:hypothetical protein [Bacteroidales bacterium]